jgi:CheY-like chemotaxis protein
VEVLTFRRLETESMQTVIRLVTRGKSVNRARILSADDHEEMRDQIKSLLDKEFEVLDSVGDGLALLDAAAKLHPDVCLLDISMPILNGIETAERLRQRDPAAKIVFLTIHEDQDFLEAALKAGRLRLRTQATNGFRPAACNRRGTGGPYLHFFLQGSWNKA